MILYQCMGEHKGKFWAASAMNQSGKLSLSHNAGLCSEHPWNGCIVPWCKWGLFELS